MKFYSLSSGSSGNCYYLGDKHSGILIDAGISTGSIRQLLKDIEIPMEAINGVLLTHNHGDHIRGLSLLARKNYLPVYTTEKVWKSTEPKLKKSAGITVRMLETGKATRIDEFEVEPFIVSHDTPETIGFCIKVEDKVLTIATDLGTISPTNASYLKAANILVLESNYDEEMLKNGNYPPFLKSRIASDHGHLDNCQASAFIAENLHGGLRHICLAHLSKSNNSPEKALSTLQSAFAAKGIELERQPEICVLKRFGLSKAIEF